MPSVPSSEGSKKYVGINSPIPRKKHKCHCRFHSLDALAIAYDGDIQDKEWDADGVIWKSVLCDAGSYAVRIYEQGYQRLWNEHEECHNDDAA